MAYADEILLFLPKAKPIPYRLGVLEESDLDAPERSLLASVRRHNPRAGVSARTLIEQSSESVVIHLAELGLLVKRSDEFPQPIGANDRLGIALNSALAKGRVRRADWRCTSIEPEWDKQTSDIIVRVVLDQQGQLSGTMRLVKCHTQIAQIYFEPGGRPRVVAVYARAEKLANPSK